MGKLIAGLYSEAPNQGNSEAFAGRHEIRQDVFGEGIVIVTRHGLPRGSPARRTKARKSSSCSLCRDFTHLDKGKGNISSSLLRASCFKGSFLDFSHLLPENYLVLYSSKHGLMSMRGFSPSSSASFPFQPLFRSWGQSIISSWDQSSVLNFTTAWEKAAH